MHINLYNNKSEHYPSVSESRHFIAIDDQGQGKHKGDILHVLLNTE